MSSAHLDAVAALLAKRSPACGSTTVVAVDGPSGSGKTQLALQLGQHLPGAVFHLEDVYPGWHGLDAVAPLVARDVLAPIAVGEIGVIHRWDWEHGRHSDTIRIFPPALLILDGTGSGARILRPYLSLIVWVEAPEDVRHHRAMTRDGVIYEPFWDVWAGQERSHFRAERTRSAADVIIDTGR